jgi:putative ABC transporter-associated repeat protein
MRALMTKLAAGSLAAVMGAAVPAAASVEAAPTPGAASGRTVAGDGHVDIGPRFADGKWIVQVRDDNVNPPVWRNVEDVVLHAVDAAKTQVPEGDQFSFLGKPGADVWVLPQVQRESVLWPGWNTQDPQVASSVDREVTWRLRGVTGPGRFVLFVNGDFGAPRILFDGSRPHPQQMGIDLNTHAHGNWAFSAPGTYLLDIDMSARTREGGQVGDRRLLRVFVGPGSADAAFNVPPPPGFTAGGTASTPSRAGSGDGVPMWVWVIAGVAGAALVIAVTTVVLRSRRAAATGQEKAE